MSTEQLRSGDPLVASVLAAATAPAEPPLPGEAEALAAFRRAYLEPRRRRVVHSLVRAKVTTLAVAGGVVLAGGVATAATGGLPGVASVTGHHHSHAPSTGPDSHSASHPATRGPEQVTPGGSANPTHPAASPQTSSPGEGATVSGDATDRSTTGVDKATTVCSTASDGACRVPTAVPAASPSHRPQGSQQTGVSHRSTGRQQPRVAPTDPR